MPATVYQVTYKSFETEAPQFKFYTDKGTAITHARFLRSSIGVKDVSLRKINNREYLKRELKSWLANEIVSVGKGEHYGGDLGKKIAFYQSVL